MTTTMNRLRRRTLIEGVLAAIELLQPTSDIEVARWTYWPRASVRAARGRLMAKDLVVRIKSSSYIRGYAFATTVAGRRALRLARTVGRRVTQ